MPSDLPPEIVGARRVEEPPDMGETGEVDERERLLAALKKAKGNRSLAARQLGISRATLYRRIRELGI